MDIRRFDPETASDDELHVLFDFSQRLHAERRPDDPPLLFDSFAANIRDIPPVVEVAFFAAWDGDRLVGRANHVTPTTDDNQHLIQFEITILPEYRRRGIGTRLLAEIARLTRENGRRLLITDTLSSIPAGAGFLERIGAQAALEGHVNELRLADVDRDLMRSWIEAAKEQANGFELKWWENGYPEDRLEEVSILYDAFNTQPMGDLEVEDFHYSAEQMRAIDERRKAQGIVGWTAYVEEQSTGTIAGYTELFIREKQPQKAEQGITAVKPEFRNRGLGRWLKAAMVEKVFTASPATETISTGNANVNAPMLKINNEMGFRPAVAETVWQVPLEQVETYLESRGVISS